MTYPLQEGISGGLVNWVSQVLSERLLSNWNGCNIDFFLQPVAILMIVVGAKFVTVDGHMVPVAWTIAGLVFIGAIITSEKRQVFLWWSLYCFFQYLSDQN